METTALQAFLDTVGTFLESTLGWMGDLLEVIVSNPVLVVVCLAMPIVGFAVGILSRLIRSI